MCDLHDYFSVYFLTEIGQKTSVKVMVYLGDADNLHTAG